jgi:hypothetical protein
LWLWFPLAEVVVALEVEKVGRARRKRAKERAKYEVESKS